MKIYLFLIEIEPGPNSPEHGRINSGNAFFFVRDSDPASATLKVGLYIRRRGWKVIEVERSATEVTENSFCEVPDGERLFQEAKRTRMAVEVVGWTDRLIETPYMEKMPGIRDVNLSEHIKRIEQNRDSGRCLHYDQGERCDHFINAHSIQKGGQLRSISDNNEVYVLSANFSDIRKFGGQPVFRRKNIKSVSTFKGFCSKHDNLTFRPIDDGMLMPTKEQILLYAYRSLCREYCVKENSINSTSELLENYGGSEESQKVFELYLIDAKKGFKGLRHHKNLFETSIASSRFSDVEYVIFNLESSQTLAFSGLLYPDWGFGGEFIQNIVDLENDVTLLTFCSAPTASGWAFIFAWHSEGDSLCRNYMNTLKGQVVSGAKIEDILLWYVFTCCENSAISPQWWESLNEDQRESLSDAAAYGADILQAPDRMYLKPRIENISGWIVSSIQDSEISNPENSE